MADLVLDDPAAAPVALRRLQLATPVGARLVVEAPAAWPRRLLDDLLVGAGLVPRRRRGEADRPVGLADTVRDDLRLLCVGINPSVVAAEAGVAFVGATNRFWPAVLAVGLAPVARDPLAALDAGLGLTDLVKRPTPRAHHLDPAEHAAGLGRLERLVARHRPRAVAFVGLGHVRAAIDARAVAGPQPWDVAGRPAYVLPSTSGANAHAPLAVLVEHLRAAAALGDRAPAP